MKKIGNCRNYDAAMGFFREECSTLNWDEYFLAHCQQWGIEPADWRKASGENSWRSIMKFGVPEELAVASYIWHRENNLIGSFEMRLFDDGSYAVIFGEEMESPEWSAYDFVGNATYRQFQFYPDLFVECVAQDGEMNFVAIADEDDKGNYYLVVPETEKDRYEGHEVWGAWAHLGNGLMSLMNLGFGEGFEWIY